MHHHSNIFRYNGDTSVSPRKSFQIFLSAQSLLLLLLLLLLLVHWSNSRSRWVENWIPKTVQRERNVLHLSRERSSVFIIFAWLSFSHNVMRCVMVAVVMAVVHIYSHSSMTSEKEQKQRTEWGAAVEQNQENKTDTECFGTLRWKLKTIWHGMRRRWCDGVNGKGQRRIEWTEREMDTERNRNNWLALLFQFSSISFVPVLFSFFFFCFSIELTISRLVQYSATFEVHTLMPVAMMIPMTTMNRLIARITSDNNRTFPFLCRKILQWRWWWRRKQYDREIVECHRTQRSGNYSLSFTRNSFNYFISFCRRSFACVFDFVAVIFFRGKETKRIGKVEEPFRLKDRNRYKDRREDVLLTTNIILVELESWHTHTHAHWLQL